MDPILPVQLFWGCCLFFAAFCFCDKCICKPCIKIVKNNPNLFTPPSTPESNQPPPNSPASSNSSSNSSYEIDSDYDLPSPATMKPDYSSSEEYIDIYIEYNKNNMNMPTN